LLGTQAEVGVAGDLEVNIKLELVDGQKIGADLT
jgi:hypothetical protein